MWIVPESGEITREVQQFPFLYVRLVHARDLCARRRARLRVVPLWSALDSSGVRAPPRPADSPDLRHRIDVARVSLHNARALTPTPSAESDRRWRPAAPRSPQWPLRCQTVLGIAAVAPILNDRHGARRTSRNRRDRD